MLNNFFFEVFFHLRAAFLCSVFDLFLLVYMFYGVFGIGAFMLCLCFFMFLVNMKVYIFVYAL